MTQETGEEQEVLSTNSTRVNELMLVLRKTIPSLKNWVDSKGNFYPPVEQPASLGGSRDATRMPVTDPLLGTAPKRDKKQFKRPGQLDVLENTDASDDFIIPNAPDDLSITDAGKIIQVALGQLTRQQERLAQELRDLTMVSTLVHYITTYISDADKKDQAIGELIKQARCLYEPALPRPAIRGHKS
jgi:hypothetical protein